MWLPAGEDVHVRRVVQREEIDMRARVAEADALVRQRLVSLWTPAWCWVTDSRAVEAEWRGEEDRTDLSC